MIIFILGSEWVGGGLNTEEGGEKDEKKIRKEGNTYKAETLHDIDDDTHDSYDHK